MKHTSRLIKAFACSFVVSTLLATAPANAGDAAAPDFTLPAKSGPSIQLSQYKGKVVMLNFWASWCVPCRTEMPLMDQIYKKMAPAGFVLLAVNVDPDSADALKFLSQVPVSFPIAYDRDNKVAKIYGVETMPSTVFIDRKGHVRQLHRGYKPGAENDYLAEIRTLIKEPG